MRRSRKFFRYGQERSVFLIHRSFAASADINTLDLTVYVELHFVHIGTERSDGVSIGVTDVFACGSAFAAYSAYFAHCFCCLRFRITVIIYHSREIIASEFSNFFYNMIIFLL